MTVKIIASGTFDHLHDGHKFFLKTALENGFVLVGLASQTLIRKKENWEKIEPYALRKDNLVKWFSLLGLKEAIDFEIIKIETKHGFACHLEDIDAILVTKENEDVAKEINTCRAKKRYPPLNIIKCKLLTDKKGKISSTRIRKHPIF
ncbi:MAG: pantetheine-phosphate adenylyltransferase [Candidatus Methanofastidiosia archaeon]